MRFRVEFVSTHHEYLGRDCKIKNYVKRCFIPDALIGEGFQVLQTLLWFFNISPITNLYTKVTSLNFRRLIIKEKN